MKISVNGEYIEVPDQLNVKQFLEMNNIDDKVTIVEHNGDILSSIVWESIFLHEGDSLEILNFVGGG